MRKIRGSHPQRLEKIRSSNMYRSQLLMRKLKENSHQSKRQNSSFCLKWALKEQGTQGEHQNIDLESGCTERTYLPKRRVLLLLLLLTSQRPVPLKSRVFIKSSISAFPASRTSSPPQLRTRPKCARRTDTFTQSLRMRFALKAVSFNYSS